MKDHEALNVDDVIAGGNPSCRSLGCRVSPGKNGTKANRAADRHRVPSINHARPDVTSSSSRGSLGGEVSIRASSRPRRRFPPPATPFGTALPRLRFPSTSETGRGLAVTFKERPDLTESER